jgi:hypothetical protein
MSVHYYDIVIIGSGMSGLYSALKIKEYSPDTSFIILEKYKEKWIGGRTSNDTFAGVEVVTGAGIGRKEKDNLLLDLVQKYKLKSRFYRVNPSVSNLISFVNVNKVMTFLRSKFNPKIHCNLTFEEFAKPILKTKLYTDFIQSAGYSDYEKEDAEETLYFYGMDDNSCCWEAFTVPWKELVLKLYKDIGSKHFHFSQKVIKIEKREKNPCLFEISTEKEQTYFCNRVIIGTTIDTTRMLLPQFPIYNDIQGQPFLRLYGKFDTASAAIMRQLIHGFTFVKPPIQRIIPMDPNKGVYMIAYNDNKNSLALKDHLENNQKNREFLSKMLDQVLNLQPNTLRLLSIKAYYWPIGTHFYKPLNRKLYKNRSEFVDHAQHPEKGMLVVGEAVSRNQGWTQGALESVQKVVTKSWVSHDCF